MPKAGLPSLVLGSAVIVSAIACTSVGPVVPSVGPASPSPSLPASVLPTLPTPDVVASVPDLPSPLISIAPASVEPSSVPTTPTVTKTPKPTVAPAANLVVTKFEIDADYVLAETPVDAVFTVRNSGTSDAGAFTTAVAETNTDNGVQSTSDPYAVAAGLGAGKLVKVTISISLPKGGNWKLAATADTDDAVVESDETDNAREVSVKVLTGLPDLQWEANGFTVTDTGEVTADGHKIELEAKFKNSGNAPLQTVTAIGVNWYRDEDSASGDLIPFTYADDMPEGGSADLSKIDYLPGPGTYTIYAYIDPDGAVYELSTDNNEEVAHITIP